MNSNWSYSPETVKLGCDLCDLDLWPWPFAWTSLLSLVITPENFMMIRWWEHSQKGVTDGRTDRRTDGQTDRRKIPFVEVLGCSLKYTKAISISQTDWYRIMYGLVWIMIFWSRKTAGCPAMSPHKIPWLFPDISLTILWFSLTMRHIIGISLLP